MPILENKNNIHILSCRLDDTHVSNQSIFARIFPNGYPVIGI